MIKEIYDLKFEPHISSGKFSISSIGQCRRRKFLEMKGLYKEEYSSKTLRAFNIGDAFHRLACEELMSKGDLLGLHVVAAEVPIPENDLFSGRADQIVADKNGEMMVVDIKSCSDWTLDKAGEGEVSDSYVWQVQLYLHFFRLKKGYILFYGKHRGEVEEYEVIYDKALCEKLIADIKEFMDNLAKDIEPGFCNKTISPFGCPVCVPK